MDKFFFFFIVVLISFVPASFSDSVPPIFAFGDSLLDAGNNPFIANCPVQANFPPYGSTFFQHPTGRFSNGRTIVDLISQLMGNGLQKPYLEVSTDSQNRKSLNSKSFPSNGINFASAGSGVLQQTNRDWNIIPIQTQLSQFQTVVNQMQKKQMRNQNNEIQRSICLFGSGSNDIYNYFIPGTSTLDQDAYVSTMLNEVVNFIEQIYTLGVRQIAILSLGPVGCVPARTLLPDAPIDTCNEQMNDMVKKYNDGLERFVLEQLPNNHPDVVVVYADVYYIVQGYQTSPDQYGFVDVKMACCGDGKEETLGGTLQCGKEGYKLCSNPNQFFYWDYYHPTEFTSNLVANDLWTGNLSQIRPLNFKDFVAKSTSMK